MTTKCVPKSKGPCESGEPSFSTPPECPLRIRCDYGGWADRHLYILCSLVLSQKSFSTRPVNPYYFISVRTHSHHPPPTIPVVTLATTSSNSFTPASSPTSPAPNLVRPPLTTTNLGPALLPHNLATPPQGSIPAPTPLLAQYVSSEPFLPLPSAPPSTRLAFATAHPPSDISSSKPKPSESLSSRRT